jgi:polyhydroxybutyrate depolymerase
MAHRMACEAADELAAIVSLAGMTWKDPSRCKPQGPVSVLQVHGDADDIIQYGGGLFATGHDLGQYPSAPDTVAQWAALNGCTGARADTGMRLDIDQGLPGSETRVERYAGCPQGAVELWTIAGGGHTPQLTADWPALLYGFLSAHAKP